MSLEDTATQCELSSAGHDTDSELVVQRLVSDALTQLQELWQTFGLSKQEQRQQKELLLASIEKSCQSRVKTWRNEVDHAKARVTELEREVQIITAEFQGTKVRLSLSTMH